MNRPELYKKTVDILYQAYFDDTLEHGWCTACAVGNIVAANNRYELNSDDKDNWRLNGQAIHPMWDNVFMTTCGVDQYTKPHNYYGEAKRQIDSTGYSFIELAKIEFAFESADRGLCEDDSIFNGLAAVLDILAQIHEITDTDLINTNSKRFSDHYKTRSICATTTTQ